MIRIPDQQSVCAAGGRVCNQMPVLYYMFHLLPYKVTVQLQPSQIIVQEPRRNHDDARLLWKKHVDSRLLIKWFKQTMGTETTFVS